MCTRAPGDIRHVDRTCQFALSTTWPRIAPSGRRSAGPNPIRPIAPASVVASRPRRPVSADEHQRRYRSQALESATRSTCLLRRRSTGALPLPVWCLSKKRTRHPPGPPGKRWLRGAGVLALSRRLARSPQRPAARRRPGSVGRRSTRWRPVGGDALAEKSSASQVNPQAKIDAEPAKNSTTLGPAPAVGRLRPVIQASGAAQRAALRSVLVSTPWATAALCR